ncbi:hypothetical protein DXG03_009366 [Asterophora parasitica]|uniref:Protein Zds1 C-terminal domain-containing protein n=1 Tax=Asterophora parasitica TaxID=117018 RepID=A0A9P7GCP0_9AGAR|nr:hypothetical protein DXG03_009366 [Asterophora parasitica]
MAARTLLPSEYDIQRERDALKDLRRRSATPGALMIDPDLPNQSPPSPPAIYRQPTPSDESSQESASGSGTSSTSESSPTTPNNPADDPFHLFWVPASLHPEIAPAEFRAFLKEHARSPPTSEDGSTSPGRSDSLTAGGSGLGRKKSMLSRQYKPDEHDGIENEQVVPLRRNRSSLYTNRGPQLTINDLQKLEELAEEASTSDDPSRLRNVLRRSLSLNISPSAIGVDELTEMVDEADAPIIVPPPGQILRRTARTKIRKPGLPGDGNGHRFGSSRRGAPSRSATAPVEPRTSSDFSSSDHGESLESNPRGSRPFSEEGFNPRPESYSEETSIFDAYVRSDEESDDPHLPPVLITPSPPPMPVELPDVPPMSQSPPPAPEALLEALGPVIHHPQPQHLLSSRPPVEQQLQGPPSRTPSPPEPTPTPPASTPAAPSPPAERPPLSHSHSAPARTAGTPSPPPANHRKEKDKKGLFGKWGGDKSGKKAKHKDKDKGQDTEEKEKDKDKDGGFFGSLFGGSKKKQDETPPPLLSPGHAGREAAQALLGASKSKSFLNASGPALPGLSAAVGPNNYSRYPIHVERAIYRLSHIKLANPRRPLYEQVLISNLMFWYLSVINKAPAAPAPAPASQQPKSGVDAQQGPENSTIGDVEKERKEREQQELRERAEKEQIEKERADRVAAERQREQQQREVEVKKKESSGRKTSLTKVPAGGGGRRAEMPVKGPQYEMQHRVMEQEYGGYNSSNGNGGQSQDQQGGVSMGRSASAPVAGSGGSPGSPPYHHQHQHHQRNPQPPPASQYNTPPKLVQPQPQHPGEHHYYNPDSAQQSQSQPSQASRLPPGAKPPDQNWRHQPQPPHMPRSHSSPARPTSPGASRSKSPPIKNHAYGHGRLHSSPSQDNLANDSLGANERLPGRSLSATAVPPQPMANGRVRKGSSAHAVAPSPQPSQGRRPRTSEGRPEQNGIGNPNGEEEDMPLAMWQRQQRR